MESDAHTVLVVDDDPMVVSSLTWLLEKRGHRFVCVGDVESATKALASEHFHALLVDVHLPDGSGLRVLDKALESDPPPTVLMMTARADIRGAVEAIRRGAADFLEKPLDLEDLGVRLDRALENARLRRKLAAYEAKDKGQTSVIAQSPAIKEAFAIADRIAATPSSSAILLGESGVGKEVLATHIHESSERRNGPFVRVNLAAIPEQMVEAELFGSVRGAFTDAKRDRAGLFASAEGGTLLLDEICEFKIELQPKLLRALEERRFFAVGSDHERRMNVRVLAATNRDPKECIAAGQLREDLYYRLATVIVRIPPLRERREDIAPLANHFFAFFRAEFRRPKCTLTDEALHVLAKYDWPGNVRELRNVIERALMLSHADEVGPESLDLPLDFHSLGSVPVPNIDTPRLEDVERAHIARVLASADGSRTRAAALLGISRSTLWEKGKRYGLF
jgi:two-component system response regulator AtoC